VQHARHQRRHPRNFQLGTRRPVRACHKFSKVSTLLYLLCKATTQRTFPKFLPLDAIPALEAMSASPLQHVSNTEIGASRHTPSRSFSDTISTK
jgi:hypothetical protein